MIAYYEDVVPGTKTRLGSHVFTREDIVAFARQWDPQPFHVDEEAAKASIFGSLCASGWHTGCVAMRKIVDARKSYEEARRLRGEETPTLGVSPGMRNMRWPTPTRPGDEISYFSEDSRQARDQTAAMGTGASRHDGREPTRRTRDLLRELGVRGAAREGVKLALRETSGWR